MFSTQIAPLLVFAMFVGSMATPIFPVRPDLSLRKRGGPVFDPSCSSQNQSVISNAISDALQLAKDGLTHLQSFGSKPSPPDDAFTRFFGLLTPEDRDKLSETLGRLTSPDAYALNYTCPSECEFDDTVTSNGDSLTDVNVCPELFIDSVADPSSLGDFTPGGDIIFVAVSAILNLPEDLDPASGMDACLRLAKDSPGETVVNPQSYQRALVDFRQQRGSIATLEGDNNPFAATNEGNLPTRVVVPRTPTGV